MQQPIFVNSFSKGFKDGIPIGLGYLSVSFTFGMMAVSQGVPIWGSVLISMTNLTSAGQFAGLSLITTGAPMIEMALTQLVINLRYALMSLSVSQKLHNSVNVLDRFAISFFMTDEIFAVSSGQNGEVGRRYMYALGIAPYIGWTLGTLLGAAAGTILPASIRSALGIAIYGMFIAIIIPPAKHLRPVLKVLILAVILSCILHWLPLFHFISSGFSIIICAVAASAFGAKFFPLQEVDD